MMKLNGLYFVHLIQRFVEETVMLSGDIVHQISQIFNGPVLQKDGQVGQSHVKSECVIWSAKLELHQDDQVCEDEASNGHKVGCIISGWYKRIFTAKLEGFSILFSVGNLSNSWAMNAPEYLQ